MGEQHDDKSVDRACRIFWSAMIVARWEWRTFGPTFAAADEIVAGLTPTGVQVSDELYLLSEAGDNVKIRAELMDIKALRAVDRHGLQQWEPVLKAAFPLDAADVASTFEALRQPLPTAAPSTYSQPELLEELVEPRHGGPPGVRSQAPGSLHVQRVHGRVDRHRSR